MKKYKKPMLDIVEFDNLDVIMGSDDGNNDDSMDGESDVLQETIHDQVGETETPLGSSGSSEQDANDVGDTNPDGHTMDNDLPGGNDAADEAEGDSADENAAVVEETDTAVETDNIIEEEPVQPEEVLDNSGAEDTVGE